MENFIGISEHRLNHSYGVAKECFRIAKLLSKDEQFHKKMFVIGFNHDIGYEFTPTNAKHTHNAIGGDMIEKTLGFTFSNDAISFVNAVKYHGNPETPEKYRTLEWYIINLADMTINSRGEKVTMKKRVEDILKRQGENSLAYQHSSAMKNILEEWLKTLNIKL